MEDREKARKKIDDIDRAISGLLSERFALSGAIVRGKIDAGEEVTDPDREEVVLSNYEKGEPRRVALAILRVSKGGIRE